MFNYFVNVFLGSNNSCGVNITATYIIENGRYLCPNCYKSYKHKSCVWRHLKYECGVERRFYCSICEKKFTRKTVLDSHLVAVHKILPQQINTIV